MMYDRFDQGGVSAWGWLLMIFMMALMFVGIVLVLHYLISDRTNKKVSPLEILKTRYAKGDIDKKEFEEKREDLKI